MMLSLFIVAVSSLTIILRFDGSLRPPRDPIPGFTYSSGVFASDELVGSEKLASCSATISTSLQHSTSAGDNEHDERLMALGAKYLPNEPGMTSADTEYEGLLLGLEWLVQAFSSEEESSFNMISKLNQSADPKLIIRGDCKTVIDQLKSRSVPRKMETKYNMGVDRIEILRGLYAKHHQRSMCDDVGTADTSISKVLSVHFEHVLREDNCFCDAICKLVTNRKQAMIVESIEDMIRLAQEDAINNANECTGCIAKHSKTQHLKRPTKKQINEPKSVHFQQAFDKICNTPQLCHSSRLALACELAKASIRQKDAATLDNLSGVFLQFSRRWSQIYYYGENSNERDLIVGRDTLRKVSTTCEKLSKICSGPIVKGNEDEEVKWCNEIDAIVDFCRAAKWMHEGSRTNPVSGSYANIPESVLNHLSDQHRRKLQLWNTVAAGTEPDLSDAMWV